MSLYVEYGYKSRTSCFETGNRPPGSEKLTAEGVSLEKGENDDNDDPEATGMEHKVSDKKSQNHLSSVKLRTCCRNMMMKVEKPLLALITLCDLARSTR